MLWKVNCCGAQGYQDWFHIGYLDGRSVPDACCLLPSQGCGQDIRGSSEVDDIIDTKVNSHNIVCKIDRWSLLLKRIFPSMGNPFSF